MKVDADRREAARCGCSRMESEAAVDWDCGRVHRTREIRPKFVRRRSEVRRRGRWDWLAGAALATVTFSLAAPLAGAAAESATPTGRWQDATMQEYRQHLIELRTLTMTCAQARDMKACDPSLVGPDDRVPWGTGERRTVRYGWLRVLLYKADEPDKAQQAAGTREETRPPDGQQEARPAPRTTSQLLQDAEARLSRDLEQAGTGQSLGPRHAEERGTLQQVLAGREFRDLEKAPPTDTALEKVGNWLNRMFAGIARLRARSKWVGRALVWGFFTGVGVLLIWRLWRMERRWKVRARSTPRLTAQPKLHAREWQVWLADARAAAAEGRWREAIHFVYWASIARLESKRLWAADRARTPREYLALMPPEDPRTGSLGFLTRLFERTWYGGRTVTENDFRRAEETAMGILGDVASRGAAEGEAG